MSRAAPYDYDLISIGSGTGGSVGANYASKLGKKVAIVEQENVLGGECPNWACVPTKALLHSADIYETVNNASFYGINPGKISINYKKIKAWKDLVVSRTGTSHAEETFAKDGIDVLRGHAHFIDPHTISIDGKRYRSRKFLIASGTKNFIPPVEGLEESGYITFREAIDLQKIPKSIFIIGGGPIGCEFAQLFSSFGSKAHLIEVAPRLLGHEEPESADLIKAVFLKRKVDVVTNGKIYSIEKKGKKKSIKYSDGKTAHHIEVDEVLVASGKRPNVDFGLENAGVKYDKHGIKTNRFMQTSAKHIWAAGDVVGPYQFTHTAAYQSRLAGHNMFARKSACQAAYYNCIPRTVFTSPEVASVGTTEEEVRKHGGKPKIGMAPVSILGRANTSNQTTGLVKVVCSHKGVILGASIVAPRAGEMIHELALAVRFGHSAKEIANMIHAFPTWSEAVKVACAKVQ